MRTEISSLCNLVVIPVPHQTLTHNSGMKGKEEKMTQDEHRAWHREHHYYLETLIADFIYHTDPSPTVQLRELRNWSFLQKITPTKTREEALDG